MPMIFEYVDQNSGLIRYEAPDNKMFHLIGIAYSTNTAGTNRIVVSSRSYNEADDAYIDVNTEDSDIISTYRCSVDGVHFYHPFKKTKCRFLTIAPGSNITFAGTVAIEYDLKKASRKDILVEALGKNR